MCVRCGGGVSVWPYILTFLGGMVAGAFLLLAIAFLFGAGQASREEERLEQEVGRTL